MKLKTNSLISNDISSKQNSRTAAFFLNVFSGPSMACFLKNLPANAGDTGSVPGPDRFHMPQGI